MQARYLQKWSGAIAGIEEIAIQEWAEVLSGLDGDQIKYGLHYLPSDWPPTAMEFRDLCKISQKKGAHQDFQKALPMPPQDIKQVESELEKLKAMVKKRNEADEQKND